MIMNADAAVEYQYELSALKREDDVLEDERKEIDKRRKEINTRIKDIAKVAVSDTESVVLPAGDHGAWHRVVSRYGAGIDVLALEAEVGTDKFRKDFCIRTVTYVPSIDKIEAARTSGKLTDETIRKVSTEGDIRYTLRKMSPKQYEKHVEKYGEDEDAD